jgi:hypothetical protein
LKTILLPTLLTLLFIFSGCSSANFKSGHKKLSEDLIKVSLYGKSEHETQKALLINCSDIALQEGYKYFTIVDTEKLVHETKMNLILTVSRTYQYFVIIKVLNTPDPVKTSYDAEAITKEYKEKLAKD